MSCVTEKSLHYLMIIIPGHTAKWGIDCYQKGLLSCQDSDFSLLFLELEYTQAIIYNDL